MRGSEDFWYSARWRRWEAILELWAFLVSLESASLCLRICLLSGDCWIADIWGPLEIRFIFLGLGARMRFGEPAPQSSGKRAIFKSYHFLVGRSIEDSHARWFRPSYTIPYGFQCIVPEQYLFACGDECYRTNKKTSSSITTKEFWPYDLYQFTFFKLDTSPFQKPFRRCEY